MAAPDDAPGRRRSANDARTILDQGNPTYNAVVGLDRTSDWVSKSRGAADDRADAVKKWLFNISDNLSDVATSIEKGCENIANQKSYLDKLLPKLTTPDTS